MMQRLRHTIVASTLALALLGTSPAGAQTTGAEAVDADATDAAPATSGAADGTTGEDAAATIAPIDTDVDEGGGNGGDADEIEGDAGTDDGTSEADARAMLERLAYIQGVIDNKLAERSALGERIEAANEQDKSDLRRQADELTAEIRELRATLETLATGGIDSSLFVDAPAEAEGDWREDVALIAQPVIDSLKELTEKPRRIAELNDLIAERRKELDVAERALAGLAPELALEPDGTLGKTLASLVRTWEKRRDDARDAIEIARFQIAELQGDKSLPRTIWEAVLGFVTGRGLTLVLAVLAALGVWAAIRFLMRGYRKKLVDKSEPESRTRYRLAEYSVHALTFLLILVAVFVVFYERGDVLLLGLLILLIVGLALGVRQLLPQYVREARLLLNIGPTREAERVVYRGLPWRVESINMFTILRNPELHGVLRIPLAEFHGLTSRPAGKDRWFPTARGDVVLFEDDPTPFEVIDQNPDTVELRERGGQIRSIPSVTFYNTTMTNLTRSGTYGVTGEFRVDYRLQGEATEAVPRVLRDAVRASLGESDLAEFVRDVLVEPKAAGDSSLDYWIFATMDSRSAKSHLRITRMIQGACIEACTEQGWTIPYPHLSLVTKSDGSDGAEPR